MIEQPRESQHHSSVDNNLTGLLSQFPRVGPRQCYMSVSAEERTSLPAAIHGEKTFVLI